MKIIAQPPALCGPASLAMLLNQPLQLILELLGHDGSEIIWPEEKGLRQRRGFSVEEFKDIADHFGYALMEIAGCPAISPDGIKAPLFIEQFPFRRNNEERLFHYMSKYPGLIVGYYSPEIYHMVAWDRGKVYDPKPRVYTYETTEDRIII